MSLFASDSYDKEEKMTNHTVVETDSGGDKHWLVLRCKYCNHVFEAPKTDTICPKCQNKKQVEPCKNNDTGKLSDADARAYGHIHLMGRSAIGGRGRDWR